MRKEESQQHENPEYYQYQEDEVELIDYLRVIWKWKWLIIVGTLLCVFAAGVYGFTRPVVRMYKVSSLIEIDPKAKLDPLDKIKTMVEHGIYNDKILKELQSFQKITKSESLNFEVNIPNGLNILDIAYKTQNPDLGKAVLNSLIKQLEQEYDQQARYQFENKLIEIGIHIAQIEALNEQSGHIKDSIAQTKKVLQEAQSISDKLTTKKQPTLPDLNDGPGYDAFIYAAAIKQVIDYPLVLRERINRLMSEKSLISGTIIQEVNILRDLAGKIELLKNEVETNIAEEKNLISRLKSQVDLLKVDFSHVKGIIVRQSPMASILPLKYKAKSKIILAGVLGFFLMLFLAFFVEYIKKASKNNKVES